MITVVPLPKYLAACGIGSRRESERLVAAGQVGINGRTAGLGEAVDPCADEVTCRGELVKLSRKVYLVLNKPRGVSGTINGAGNSGSVMNYVTGVKERIVPVGRLDKNAEGVLILTNDGDLVFRLTRPECTVKSTYLVWVQGQLTRADWGNGHPDPPMVRILHTGQDSTLIRVTLCETKKDKVRRLCALAGHPVWELRCIAYGNVCLDGLSRGAWRYLSDEEAEGLRSLTAV